jgi:Flp pilus assembly pilin Flp
MDCQHAGDPTDRVPAITPPGDPGKKEAVMLKLVTKLVREDGGQDLAEYGIALAVIAIGAAAIAVAIGTDVETLWSNAQTAIQSAVTAEA